MVNDYIQHVTEESKKQQELLRATQEAQKKKAQA